MIVNAAFSGFGSLPGARRHCDHDDLGSSQSNAPRCGEAHHVLGRNAQEAHRHL